MNPFTVVDPVVAQATADGVVERAAIELDKLLKQLAGALEPFPGFMGLKTVQAIELEPVGPAGGDKGCVVVCPDGEIYELVLKMTPGPLDVGGVEGEEEMKLFDAPLGTWVAYAHAAVGAMCGILREREGGPGLRDA